MIVLISALFEKLFLFAVDRTRGKGGCMMEIRAEHLTKSYEGRPVLRDVTFTAGAGITRIAGRSGAGKTTLLRILLGLETAESGRVLVPDGCRWAAVFQEDRLLMAKSAGGNLRFAPRRGI